MKGNLEMNHLMKFVDTDLELKDSPESKLRVSLEDKELWIKFKELTNEMIVTKSGRRMFPVLRASVHGLDPNAMYSFVINFVPVDNHRWKYVNGDWVPGGKAEPATQNAAYVHPDSPNFGAHWMKEPVSFSKVKLTNKMHGGGQNGTIMLNSLHKYQPIVHIFKVGSREERRPLSRYTFTETQFVAVTAYQNEEITALKIKYNPFAKAFQDAKERPDQREFGSGFEDISEADQKRISQFWFLPSGGPTLMPPPAHQFPSALSLPCDRFSLREHRHSPYPHHFSRRSPPHGSYPHEVTGNLSVLNLQDPWSSGGPITPAASMLSSTTSMPQSPQYMWNLPSGNQNCAVSQYLRNGSAHYISPTPDTPISLSTTSASDIHAYDSQLSAQLHDTTSPSFASPGAASSVREPRPSTAAGSWSPLTQPSH